MPTPAWYPNGYRCDYTGIMDAARILRDARHDAGLTIRELARRAGTSHSTVAAYEARRKVPTVETFDRLLRAAGFAVDIRLAPRIDDAGGDRTARGQELIEVLELAEMFPARHSEALTFPRFGAPA
jgi:transcriptional regulator with XRE-family HTH domain